MCNIINPSQQHSERLSSRIMNPPEQTKFGAEVVDCET